MFMSIYTLYQAVGNPYKSAQSSLINPGITHQSVARMPRSTTPLSHVSGYHELWHFATESIKAPVQTWVPWLHQEWHLKIVGYLPAVSMRTILSNLINVTYAFNHELFYIDLFALKGNTEASRCGDMADLWSIHFELWFQLDVDIN